MPQVILARPTKHAVILASALVALGVALVAGAAGFLASLKFLAYIFAQIKFD